MESHFEKSVSFKSRLASVLQSYQWHFVAFIIIAQLIPTLYNLSNTYWIGHLSNNALAITEQYEFPSVTIEIINEMIPFGVLALVAQNFKNKEKITTILKSGIIIQLVFSTALMSVMMFFTPQFVSTIGTPPEIVASTRSYLFLQSIALPFNSIATLLLTAIYSMRKARNAVYLVFASVIINMGMDLFLISNTSLSVHMGIEGSALGYVVSQVVLFILAAVFLIRTLDLSLGSLSFSNWRSMMRPLFSIGGWTGLDSLVRNVGYILVPLNVLNVIGTNPYGGYELAMTVMWTLIIPVLAITQGTNVVVGNYYGERNNSNIKKVIVTSLFLVTITMTAIAVGGVFFWKSLSSFFNQNPAMVEYSTATFWWLIIPYCLFALDNVLKSVFFGTGKTKYIFYISAFCNFVLIIPFWILAKLGFLVASFDNVMALFVVVFVIDLVLAYMIFRRVLTKINADIVERLPLNP